MTKQRLTPATLSHILKVLVLTSAMVVITQAEISEDSFLSSCPAIDLAARAFAEGQLDVAAQGFETLWRDASAPSFARGLALFGLAEVALSRRDTTAAIAAWKRLAADTRLLRFHRDTALRRIAEMERLQKGLAARDPASYRVQLPVLPAPGEVFYVAPTGSDTADGSQSKPFRTLERARDAVRSLKQSRCGKLPAGGVRIEISSGEYPWDRTLKLTSDDSGTAAMPIVYQAEPGQRAIFRSGAQITTWRPISDAKLRGKLDVRIRDRVLEADLKALGVEDLGDAAALRRCPELFVDGKPQTLARWPNEGFTKTGDILGKDTFKVWNRIEGCRDGKFGYVEDRPGQWLDEPDVRLYGYWFWDWFEEFQKVESIDPESQTFTLARPYSRYGYRKDRRYYALNVFRELDAEGEWYLDRRTAMAYWLAPEGIDVSKAEVVLSMCDQPFVTLTDAEHVILRGLTFQEGRGNGIHVRGGAHCLVADCTLRRLGGDAIVVEGGQRHGIFGCTMHQLGCGAMRVVVGKRQTLTPGRHFVENCRVFDISRLKRTYAPAIHLDGCGNRIAHNLFENIPSSALRIEGNDHLIELNVIRNVVRESDDQGGLDMFGNPLYRGVVIRWNRWSDIRGGTQHGAAGVRLDDMISGVAVYGNVFERCGAVNFGGVQIHGGKENLVEGNLFIDCLAGLSFSRWGQKRWLESIERFLPQADKPPYLSRYPELADLKTNADVNLICRNVFARCGSTLLRDGQAQKAALNAVTDQPLEMQVVPGRRFPGNLAMLKPLLIEPIPLGEMGPYESN
ncbi:MAG: right-handed parallel beta-helix repeat-containing protein [Planctomycetes bacterium]|nr:right-handed parallel beta-helix repeat-containing protein [Planctomycetota bacterium]